MRNSSTKARSEIRSNSFKSLRDQIKANDYFNRPNEFKEEGVDHINISMSSGSHLGKVSDPAYVKTLNYRNIGKFTSVLNLWYWLRSDDLDDNLRKLVGTRLRKYGDSKGRSSGRQHVPNFKAIIGHATWLKLRQYPALLEELRNKPDNVKYLSYNLIKGSGIRVSTNYAGMVIEIMDIITDAVKKGVDPDFTPLCDNKDQAGLHYLEGFLTRLVTPEALVVMMEAFNTPEEQPQQELPLELPL